MYSLLQHVLDDNCEDPDCEIHHLDVGISEETISEADKAFWLAGWNACRDHFLNALDEVSDETVAEGRRIIGVPL